MIPPVYSCTRRRSARCPSLPHIPTKRWLVPWRCKLGGSCLLGSAPSAAAVNAVPDKDRAAALAALRVCGDVGLLTGAAALGGVAACAGTDAAFFCASFGLVASAARFRWAAPVST